MSINTNRQQNNSETYKDFFRSIVRKTEKIVTAFYMVSDCIDVRETMRLELRSRALELLNVVRETCEDMSDDASASVKDVEYIAGSLESLSLVASSVGLMSVMNATILIAELRALVVLIKGQETNLFYARYVKHTPESLNFDKSFFGEEVLPPIAPLADMPTASPFTFVSGAQPHMPSASKSIIETSAKTNQKPISPKNEPKRTERDHKEAHQNRQAKILETVGIKGEATINDLFEALPGISEKTIQRELVALVGQGTLVRTGTKRWSKYSLPKT